MNRTSLVAALVSVACGTNNDCAEDKASPSGADTVSIITSDELCLVADHYRGDEGAPAVVLLHMTPTAWDRTSWSVDFQRRLYGLGWSVLNLDRRGAGDSEGGVRDAFEGPGGALDVQAAFDYLGAEGVGPIAIVSASNGTTSALDYLALAAPQGLVEPVSIVMMSPGTYTENQTPIETLAEQNTPTLFQYDPSEGLWIDEEYDELNPGSWQAIPYDGGGHGSHLLNNSADVSVDAADFLDEHWPALP